MWGRKKSLGGNMFLFTELTIWIILNKIYIITLYNNNNYYVSFLGFFLTKAVIVSCNTAYSIAYVYLKRGFKNQINYFLDNR